MSIFELEKLQNMIFCTFFQCKIQFLVLFFNAKFNFWYFFSDDGVYYNKKKDELSRKDHHQELSSKNNGGNDNKIPENNSNTIKAEPMDTTDSSKVSLSLSNKTTNRYDVYWLIICRTGQKI